ncbi:MAG: EamA family transporter [Methanobacteriota archaeon]
MNRCGLDAVSLAWLGWALGTAAAWGVGTLTAKPATERLGPRSMFLGVAAAEGSVFAILAVTLERGPIPMDVSVLVALLAGAAGILGYLFFYEGLQKGTVGLVGTVTGAYPGVTVVLGVLFLGETLSGQQAVGVALLIACVLLLAYEPRSSSPTHRAARLFSFLGFLAWGVWGLFAKISVEAMGEPNLFAFYAIANFAVASAYFSLRRMPGDGVSPVSRRTLGLALFTIGSGAVGVFALTFAYGEGPVSLVTPVSGSYPIIAALGAAALLKEHLGPRVAAALIAFVAGLILVSAV